MESRWSLASNAMANTYSNQFLEVFCPSWQPFSGRLTRRPTQAYPSGLEWGDTLPSIVLGGYILNGWLSAVNVVCLRRLCQGGVINLRGPFPIGDVR